MKFSLGLVALLAATLLSGCGDSGSSSGPNNNISPVPQQTTVTAGPVVFMGDSITYNWGPVGAHGPTIANPTLDQLVPGSIDVGIPSQTSAQMLARFQTDVLDHHPGVVVILAGTNDLRQGMPVDISNTEEMAHEARAAGAQVILETLLPLPGMETAVQEWNSELAGLADADGYMLVDYWSVLTRSGVPLAQDFLSDSIHPNPDGYVAMWPVLEAALRSVGYIH